MPIYEYRCNVCHQRVSIFTRSVHQHIEPTCDLCGATDLKRLVSSFAVHRTEADRLADIDTSSLDYSDSRNIGLSAKKRLMDLGAPDDMMPQVDEIIEKGRSGELLKEYEAAAESRLD